jgi:hypothetical protein
MPDGSPRSAELIFAKEDLVLLYTALRGFHKAKIRYIDRVASQDESAARGLSITINASRDWWSPAHGRRPPAVSQQQLFDRLWNGPIRVSTSCKDMPQN